MTTAAAPKPKPRRTPPGGARARPVRVAVEAAGGLELSAAEETFASLLASGSGKTQALRVAFPEYGTWTAHSQHTKSSEVAAREHVIARVAQLREIAAKTNTLDVAELLGMHLNRVRADPRELMTRGYRCCRHCHGAGHGYQRTTEELHQDRQRHADREHARTLKDLSPGPAFDEAGGAGWDETAMPHPSCPTCHGVGELRTVAGSFDNLSVEGVALLAGVREGKDGLQVLTNDKDASMNAAGRHIGFFEPDDTPPPTESPNYDALEVFFQEALAKAAEGKAAAFEQARSLPDS